VKRVGWWCVLALAAGAGLTMQRPLAAASLALSPGERGEAIQAGRKSVISDEFGGEWRVKGSAPGQSVTVVTPFHRLALAARNSAFRNEEMRPRDVDAALKEQGGGLALWVTLKGSGAEFARLYVPALTSGDRPIKASFVQNERTARREEDGSYTAQCLYVFPAEGLKANDKITLVVKDVEEKPVATFTFDLSTMR